MPDQNQPNTGLAWVAACCLMLILGMTATPLAAADESDCEDVLVESVCKLNPSLYGLATGVGDRATDAVFGDTPEPARDADNFQSALNAASDPIQEWLNQRLTANESRDTVAVTFGDSNAETVYVIADVNGTSYENLRAASSTDRAVDERCTLTDNAVTRADQEVQRFADDYASPDSNLSRAYLGGLAGRYGKNVDCTFSSGG